MRFLAEEVSKDCFVNIMEQYRPDGHVGKRKGGTGGGGGDGEGVRYREINRAVTGEEVGTVRKAAEEVGLWRFADPAKHKGFNI